MKLGTLTTVHRIYTETGFTKNYHNPKNRISSVKNVKQMLGIHSLDDLGRSIKKNHGRSMTVYAPPSGGGGKPYDSIMGVSLSQKIECQEEPFTFIHKSEGLLLALNFLT